MDHVAKDVVVLKSAQLHAPGARPRLVLDRLFSGYAQKIVVAGVSLKLEDGDIIALLGLNGSGKSTLLKAIMGLVPVSAGTVLMDGADLTHASISTRAQCGVAYFGQGGRVFPSLTVAENCAVAAVDRQMNVIDLFPQLAAAPHKRAGLLSGGQRHQLALAMVLSRRPRVLLLDEPTAGVSAVAASAMMEAVARTAENGAAVLLVEQNPELALRKSSTAMLMADGVIVSTTETPTDWLLFDTLEAIMKRQKPNA
jgi:ABC-type branched-subunit amino acid transport system ATPase component